MPAKKKANLPDAGPRARLVGFFVAAVGRGVITWAEIEAIRNSETRRRLIEDRYVDAKAIPFQKAFEEIANEIKNWRVVRACAKIAWDTHRP